jgi:hypothetical protein
MACRTVVVDDLVADELEHEVEETRVADVCARRAPSAA